MVAELHEKRHHVDPALVVQAHFYCSSLLHVCHFHQVWSLLGGAARTIAGPSERRRLVAKTAGLLAVLWAIVGRRERASELPLGGEIALLVHGSAARVVYLLLFAHTAEAMYLLLQNMST